jgi:hypothetical protein
VPAGSSSDPRSTPPGQPDQRQLLGNAASSHPIALTQVNDNNSQTYDRADPSKKTGVYPFIVATQVIQAYIVTSSQPGGTIRGTV